MFVFYGDILQNSFHVPVQSTYHDTSEHHFSRYCKYSCEISEVSYQGPTNESCIFGFEIKIVLMRNDLWNILTYQGTKNGAKSTYAFFTHFQHWIQLPCEWQWKRHVFKRYKLNDKHAEWEIWKKKSWDLHNLVCRNGVLRICKLFFVYLLRLYTHVLTVWLYLRGNWQAASYFEVRGHKVW